MVTEVRKRSPFIDSIVQNISQDKKSVDELRLKSLVTRLRGRGLPINRQPPPPPVFPQPPRPPQPFPVSGGVTPIRPRPPMPVGELKPEVSVKPMVQRVSEALSNLKVQNPKVWNDVPKPPPATDMKSWFYKYVETPLSKEFASGKIAPQYKFPLQVLGQLGAGFLEQKPFQEMPTSEKILTVGLDIAAALPWGRLLSKGGRQVIKQAVIDEAMANYNMTFGKSLDAMIVKRAAGIPPEQFNVFQNAVYDVVAKNKPAIQQVARERMLYRMGRTPNVTQATEQAVADTIGDIETRLVPKGTQTGAMAFGGKQVPTPKEFWQMTKAEVYDKARELLTPGAEGRPFTVERTTLLNKQVNYHKELVSQALSEGKSVPPEVLKDYPDLVKAIPPEAVVKPPSVKAAGMKGGVPAKGTPAPEVTKLTTYQGDEVSIGEMVNFGAFGDRGLLVGGTTKDALVRPIQTKEGKLIGFKDAVNVKDSFRKIHEPLTISREEQIILDKAKSETLKVTPRPLGGKGITIVGKSEERVMPTVSIEGVPPKIETPTPNVENIALKPSLIAQPVIKQPTPELLITQPPPPNEPLVEEVTGITPPSKKPSLTQLNKIIEQSQVIVKRDRPNTFTKIIGRIPGIKKIAEFERPGLLMQGENEKILVAHVAEAAARSDIATRTIVTRGNVVEDLKTNFGIRTKVGQKTAIHGAKTKVKFIGTPEQARNPITGTIKDIADNPELYKLTDVQKSILVKLNQRNDELLSFVVDNYGAEIGHFPTKEGGAFLPNVDISEDVVEAIGGEMRAIASGRQKTRFYPSARERMEHDKTFKPELDIEKLLIGLDRAKATAAAGQTFRQVLGGKTRLEVIQETHPSLAKKMEALKKKLSSLQGSAGTIESNVHKAIYDFLNSPVEGTDLLELRDSLDVKLKVGIRKGLDVEAIQNEIASVRDEIKELRPAWEVANLKPYQFVQQGIYRYFPEKQVTLIKDLLKTSDNSFLNFIENIRGTAFSGDLSPILGVQTPVGILADPIGAFTQAGGGLKKMIVEKNPLISFTVEGLAKDIGKDVEGWAQFFSLMGRAPEGTPREFAGGFLSKIPGFSKFNESTFLIVTRQSKNMYDKNWKALVKSGLPELDAKVAAITISNQVFPFLSSQKLGQSQARHTLLGSLPTSYSFIRKPAELMANAAKGFAKTATFQRVKGEELIAMKIIITMAASAMVAAAISQAIRAKQKGNDIKQAIIDSINPDPENGKFLSVMIGDTRVPIGGMYRALFRAIYPQKIMIGGKTLNVPFVGLPPYLKNRLNVALRVQYDLLKNEDYYGQKIRKGDIAEQILRVLAYEFEGMIPLTIGAGIEAIRTGLPKEETLTQVAGQFAGLNIIQSKWYEVQSLREKYSKKDYGMTYDTLNSGQKDDLLRNHADLKSIYDEAKGELILRGADKPKIYAELTDLAVTERNTSLNKAAQAYLDRDITKSQYDDERGRIRPYYSAARTYLWLYRNKLDPEQAKQFEQYFNESSKPEDKALDAYWEHYDQFISQQELSIDWDIVDTEMNTFLTQYPEKIRSYVLAQKDIWIKDLPQPAKQVEEERISGIEDESWWDNYRGTTTTRQRKTRISGFSRNK